MAKKNLTESGIKALRPAAQGQRYDVMDSQVPGFGLRINHQSKAEGWPQGQYMLVAYFPGGKNPVRRTIGRIGVMKLADAREKAREWRKQIASGKDPSQEEGRQRLALARQRQTTFAGVAEDFITEKLPGERKGKEVERDIRRDLIPKLGDRPITEIERIDIRDIIKAKKAKAPAQARNLLGITKRLFSWAVAQEVYGLKASPCSEIKTKEIIGERTSADRNLSDDEIFALWRATTRLSYPYKQIYQLLMLNGLRLNEVVDASASEFDFKKREWTIPAARMKGKNSKARPHLVPLTNVSLQIIGMLPTFTRGPYLFSCNFGQSPVWG